MQPQTNQSIQPATPLGSLYMLAASKENIIHAPFRIMRKVLWVKVLRRAMAPDVYVHLRGKYELLALQQYTKHMIGLARVCVMRITAVGT